MKIGNRDFDFTTQPYIMGILNVTPDSFSDGGRYNNVQAAVDHAVQMVEEGADIIDIGAESTRPGHVAISAVEETARLLPALRAVRQAVDVPISVDTYRASVAAQALANGADMINDIWGLTFDEALSGIVAHAGCPICIMHNRKEDTYGTFLPEWMDDMRDRIRLAKEAGIKDEAIIIDPGIGFAKHFSEDSAAMRHLHEFCDLGYPVLLGVSRKRLIGTLTGQPVDERDEGTAALSVYGYLAGARIFRVHNVALNRRMLDAVWHLKETAHD
jgi:dihydropteroate synthase